MQKSFPFYPHSATLLKNRNGIKKFYRSRIRNVQIEKQKLLHKSSAFIVWCHCWRWWCCLFLLIRHWLVFEWQRLLVFFGLESVKEQRKMNEVWNPSFWKAPLLASTVEKNWINVAKNIYNEIAFAMWKKNSQIHFISYEGSCIPRSHQRVLVLGFANSKNQGP